MEDYPKKLQVTLNQNNIKTLVDWANERELKPSQAINKIIQIFFLNQEKLINGSDDNSVEVLEKIGKLSKKVDFIRAIFTGSILELIESSVLVKEASWNTEKSINAAQETKDYYENIIDKYATMLEEK